MAELERHPRPLHRRAEVAGQLGVEDLPGARLDVVGDPVVLGQLRLGVVDDEARAVVAVARLPHRADRDHVLVPSPEGEPGGHHLVIYAERALRAGANGYITK